MLKIIFSIILGVHGLIHLMGFLKAFNLAELEELKKPVPRPAGIVWLLAAILFLVSLSMFLFNNNYWWVPGGAAVLFSQVVIFINWSDARIGTVANLIVVIPLIASFMNFLPSSYRNIYRGEVEKQLLDTGKAVVVSKDDLRHLPEPVRKYLNYAGVVGRPGVKNFRAVFEGEMKFAPEKPWSRIDSQQFNFPGSRARLFYIESKMYGIPLDGLHAYVDRRAGMQIKIASLLQVVDARGREMNQSETVTFLNDLCLLAPGALIDRSIAWKAIDDLSAEARFSIKDTTIKAVLYFNRKGELVNFVSHDRFLSADGKTYKRYRWSTPVKDYIEKDGRRIVSSAEAIWRTPEGDFSYARYRLKEIEYNLDSFK